jgi:hypothetical protein
MSEPSFEERHGWSPDIDYEEIECTHTPEEQSKALDEALKSLGIPTEELAKKVVKLIVKDYGEAIKKLGEE